MLTVGPLNEIARIRHGFFSRDGGVSDGPFASLNCGYGSGDDPAKVTENRARAMERLDLDGSRLVTAYQTHSTEVAVVEEPWNREDAPRVDGLVTTQPRLALGILTADCAPVLMADAKARVIGAAHAGWRGALNGILEAVIEAMIELGARRNTIVVGVGPTIGQRSWPTSRLPPSSSPANSRAAPAPTMTSLRPHSKRRPAAILKRSRTSKAAGTTPRSGTLASVPVERLGRLMMTNSSEDAIGPPS